MTIQLKVSPANSLAFVLSQASLKLKKKSSLSNGKYKKNYNYENFAVVYQSRITSLYNLTYIIIKIYM